MSKQGKKTKGLSAARVQELVKHATLVSLGLREAYLLEGLTIERTELKDLLEKKVYSEGMKGEHSLGILQLGFADMVIVNIKTLASKLSLLQTDSGAWEAMNQPLLVNLDGRVPAILSAERERRSLATSIWRAFRGSSINDGESMPHSDHTAFNIVALQFAEDDVQRCIGYPFLAGWLLGYVCIYHCISGDGSALSNVELEKISINVKFDDSPPLPVMEFSYPTSIFNEESQRGAFQRAVDQKVETITNCATSSLCAEVLQSSTEISVTVKKSLHCLTAVTL